LLKQKIGIILCLIILCIYSYQFMTKDSDSHIYGDDKESIVKAIQLIEQDKSKEEIEILKIIDIKNDRIVAYLYKNGPGFIQFTKKLSGNYLVTDNSNGSDNPLEPYVLDIDSDASIQMLLLVNNEDNNISKVKLNVNNQTIEKQIKVGQKSFSISKIPKSNNDNYDFKYE